MNGILDAQALLWTEFPWVAAVALLIGALLPIAGCHVVTRRAPFLAAALPQAAFAGLALGLLIFPVFAAAGDGEADAGPPRLFLLASALAATAATLGALSIAARVGRTPDTGSHAALAFTALAAVAEIARAAGPVGGHQIEHLLHGEILAASGADCARVAAILVPAAAWMFLRRRRWFWSAAQPLAARAAGLSPGRATLGFLIGVGASAAAVVPVAGPLPCFAALLAPAVLARPAARSLDAFFALAVVSGVLGAYVGAVGAVALEWPIGASAAIGVCVVSAGAAACDTLFRRGRPR